jgi:hypothetical protein
MSTTLPEGWYDLTVPLQQNMPYLVIDTFPPRIYRYRDFNLGD